MYSTTETYTVYDMYIKELTNYEKKEVSGSIGCIVPIIAMIIGGTIGRLIFEDDDTLMGLLAALIFFPLVSAFVTIVFLNDYLSGIKKQNDCYDRVVAIIDSYPHEEGCRKIDRYIAYAIMQYDFYAEELLEKAKIARKNCGKGGRETSFYYSSLADYAEIAEKISNECSFKFQHADVAKSSRAKADKLWEEEKLAEEQARKEALKKKIEESKKKTAIVRKAIIERQPSLKGQIKFNVGSITYLENEYKRILSLPEEYSVYNLEAERAEVRFLKFAEAYYILPKATKKRGSLKGILKDLVGADNADKIMKTVYKNKKLFGFDLSPEDTDYTENFSEAAIMFILEYMMINDLWKEPESERNLTWNILINLLNTDDEDDDSEDRWNDDWDPDFDDDEEKYENDDFSNDRFGYDSEAFDYDMDGFDDAFR